MTQYQIEWSESKSPDWKKISIKDPSGQTFTDVSVNRKAKDGTEFPNFDGVVVGATVEGNYWESPNGAKYLFGPKPASTGQIGGNKGMSRGIAQAQETKRRVIETAQENKEVVIKLSSTIRMAVDIVTARDLGSTEDIQAEIEYWRKWLWERWDEPTDRQWPTV